VSGCVLLNLKSERVAGELFRTLDVVEKMVDERGFEPPAPLVANEEKSKLRLGATVT
jgi:hypothetical protein